MGPIISRVSVSISELANVLNGRRSGADCLVRSITTSSRSIAAPNETIFTAVRGVKQDGHSFIAQAFEQGATAAIVEDESALAGRPGIIVKDARRALSQAGAYLAGDPSSQIKVIGITGTNGKTTTHWVIRDVLTSLGCPTARLGTLGYEVMGESGSTGLTTPDALGVQSFLALAVARGCGAAVMETSSHALDQSRVEDVKFDAAVFTNLTRDHLDYHPDFESYFRAKCHLFELLARSPKPTKVSVVNRSDEYGERLWSEYCSAKMVDHSFGWSKAAVAIYDFSQSFKGSRFILRTAGSEYRVSTPLIGMHNAENLAAAFGVAAGLGFSPEQVVASFEGLKQVPGRLQSVMSSAWDQDFGVYVDYAHSPDALERVLQALRPLTRGNLLVVFGCGGDRDRGKRPEMRKVATRLSDQVFVTSDNPRSENPAAIVQEILAGMESSEARKVSVELDRRSAIRLAIDRASRGDVVLIAGKGHEDYQIIGDQSHHFSDSEEALFALNAREQ